MNGKTSGAQQVASWRGMLRATPVRNTAAETVQHGPDELSLSVKTKRPRYMVPPLSWIVPMKPTRTVRLDRVGMQIWNLCDGRRTVEEIVDEFAELHRLTFHEARVAVTGYMRQLVQRGVLAIAMTE